MLLTPGTLLNLAIAKTDHALNCGALQPIATNFDYIEAGSIRFLVRIFANLQRKIADKKQQNLKKTNPFLPYDPDLWVADLTSTHLCLLNKFNAVDYHLLIVTREYESQENWLNLADFEALSISLTEIDALGFYNGGKLAGSSQPHKHLQLIPLPLSPDGMRLPIEIAIATAKFQENLGKITDYSFVHALVRLPDFEPLDLKSAAAELLSLYHLLLVAVGLSPHGTLQTGAYNLLVTREWMMIVLRSQESFQGMGVNALGFAGALLVADAEQLAQLKALSPLQLLEAVAVRSEK